jgi:type III secretion protein V
LFDLPVLAFNELSTTIRFEVVGQIGLPAGMIPNDPSAPAAATVAAE